MKAENDPVLVSKSFRVGYSPWAHKESDRTERPTQPVASQVALVVKNLPVMEETYLGLIPGLGRSPGGGHGNPLQYSYLENPHGQRSLRGYSPWGHKESDTTKHSVGQLISLCLVILISFHQVAMFPQSQSKFSLEKEPSYNSLLAFSALNILKKEWFSKAVVERRTFSSEHLGSLCWKQTSPLFRDFSPLQVLGILVGILSSEDADGGN